MKILTGQVIILTTEKTLSIEPWAFFSSAILFPSRPSTVTITKSNAVTRLNRLIRANVPENVNFGYKMTSSKTSKIIKNIKERLMVKITNKCSTKQRPVFTLVIDHGNSAF